jgi:hypothetical protein
MHRFLFSLLAVIVLGQACQSSSAAASANAVALLGTWSGQQGAGTTPGTRVIRTEDDWLEFLGMVGNTPTRVFNPRRETVFVVMLGERRSGGYSVEVLRAWTENRQLVLECRESRPAPGTMTTQEITYPWTAVFVPRTNLPVTVRYVTPPPGAKK